MAWLGAPDDLPVPELDAANAALLVGLVVGRWLRAARGANKERNGVAGQLVGVLVDQAVSPANVVGSFAAELLEAVHEDAALASAIARKDVVELAAAEEGLDSGIPALGLAEAFVGYSV